MTSIGEAHLVGGGSNRLAVAPSRPCALSGCAVEVVTIGKRGDTLGVVHLNDAERQSLIARLGGASASGAAPTVTQGMVEEARRELRNHTRWYPTQAVVRTVLAAAIRVMPGAGGDRG